MRVVTDVGEGWGECVGRSTRLLERVRRRCAGRDEAPASRPGAGRAATSTPTRGRLLARSGATGWRRPRSSWRCSMPSCGPRGGPSAASSAPPATGCRAACLSASWTIPALLDAVDGYLDDGYLRIKLKIEPGCDLDPVRAVRERFGDDRCSKSTPTPPTRWPTPRTWPGSTLRPAAHRAAAAEDDLVGHAALARRLRTPLCLDESIVSARTAAAAIPLGACSVVNIKPGRVGGYLEARRIHDVCVARACRSGAAGCSRPASVGPPTSPSPRCPGFTLPGDPRLGRYFTTDSPSLSSWSTAASRCRPGRASGSSRCRRCSPRSRRRRHHRPALTPGAPCPHL